MPRIQNCQSNRSAPDIREKQLRCLQLAVTGVVVVCVSNFHQASSHACLLPRIFPPSFKLEVLKTASLRLVPLRGNIRTLGDNTYWSGGPARPADFASGLVDDSEVLIVRPKIDPFRAGMLGPRSWTEHALLLCSCCPLRIISPLRGAWLVWQPHGDIYSGARIHSGLLIQH